jgi:HPt (histidine-containing phosphotransfer) domain-containing protein
MSDVEADAALDGSVMAELWEFTGPEDGSTVGRFVGLFLDEARGHLRDLRAAAAAQDIAGVARVAHQLQGSAGFVGAIGLRRLSRDIERSARAGSIVDLGPRLGRLNRALDLLTPRLLTIAAPAADDVSALDRIV